MHDAATTTHIFCLLALAALDAEKSRLSGAVTERVAGLDLTQSPSTSSSHRILLATLNLNLNLN
jgi:hypothetical protein